MVMPWSADILSNAVSRYFMDERFLRSQLERTPDGETKLPGHRSSSLTLNCP